MGIPIRQSVCLLVLALAGCASAKIADDVPLHDRAVEAPGAGISPELAAFSGRWIGVWTDGRSYRKNMALIVERVVAPDRAVGFYACGHATPKANPVCPSSMPVTGQLDRGILKISYPAIHAEGRYRVDDDALRGEMVDSTSGKLLIWVTATRLP
jgi:hypothetical protein